MNLSKIVTTQSYYTLASRDIEREIVPLIQAEKLGLLVWSLLAGGLLSGKFGRHKPGEDGSRRASFNAVSFLANAPDIRHFLSYSQRHHHVEMDFC